VLFAVVCCCLGLFPALSCCFVLFGAVWCWFGAVSLVLFFHAV
jgi:hypothetical protein